jgi:Ca-activated chloride channel family protein
MSQQESNYYQMLGLRRSATAPEIEAAFLRAQARSAAPGTHELPAGYDYLAHAYEVLRDPERRARYDQLLGQIEVAVESRIQASATELAIMDTAQMVYLLVELRPRSAGDTLDLPLNLCLVVDRSTSMRGERIDRVQKALLLLLEQVAEGDTLALVSFSDRAEVLLPAAPRGSHHDARREINLLQPSGGTEIYQGLLAGVTQLRLAAGPQVNSQLILLTDGRTYGDEDECLQLAAAAAAEGITIHAFGIGSDWDDQFLDALVSPSGGLVEHINAPEEVITALSQRLQGLGKTYARDVRLRLELPPSLEVLDGLRLTPFAQLLPVKEPELALGNIEGHSALKFLLVLAVNPQPIAARIRIPFAFTADFPFTGQQSFTEQIELTIGDTAPVAAPPPAVWQAARLLNLFRLSDQAWHAAESGELESAASRMRYLATRLLELGEPTLAEQADREASRLALTGELSAEHRKQLKYGTRSLTRKSLPLEPDD